ncbi:exodeoxyribonuclease VII large subunit [Pseudaeromonas paramecii]|uniref:Exodeoxyribonuclease 7 large subunit n=1 Tax=Pseudaeromonas paramecii TaxID=2138166 RepID=A0ABP8QFR8_9GAMM
MLTTPSQPFTVSRLNRTVRLLLEDEIGLVWLTGELSNLVLHGSGHWYFSLKDPGAQVRCAMFRGNNRRVAFRPQEGQQVLVQARLSLYEPRGDYQLVVESMRLFGEGQLQLQLEQLKQRLQAEGLFDVERKRPLPSHPRQIGIITSPTGAAIRDMLQVLARRAPDLPVVIYPSPVQGAEAAPRLLQALELAWTRNECDVLLIGRGGGALEDLWSFNDERLVRAIAHSPIPIVSAVGHETDVTLSDFAADLRAPTPSAAAELVSPDLGHRQERLARLAQRLERSLRHRLALQQLPLQQLARRLQLQDPQRQLQQRQQGWDRLLLRLQQAGQRLARPAEQRLQLLRQRLLAGSPAHRLAQQRQSLAQLEHGLRLGIQRQTRQGRQQLALAAARLQDLSPLAILARGYALTYDSQGQLLHSSQQVQEGDEVETRLHQGRLRLKVLKRLA